MIVIMFHMSKVVETGLNTLCEGIKVMKKTQVELLEMKKYSVLDENIPAGSKSRLNTVDEKISKLADKQ